ncbi:MAG: hypothetical protein CL567_05050 [Alphaproteobacteria bacterium]|nr:hypothetical protein [Alphaproteobacteria bacterium]|tara:strand:- start:34061 stop:34960 length:900 start_codon:yes stop_codon:yes gene_type:complete
MNVVFTKGLVLLIGITFCWGINWPIMKIGMLEIPVFPFRAIVLLIGGITLFSICKLFRQPLLPSKKEWPAIIAIACALSIFQVFSGYGVLFTESGRAAVMAYTMPVWAIALGWLFLGEKPGWVRIFALALGIGGMSLLLIADITTIGNTPLGMIFMLITAISWAIATIIQKRAEWSLPTLSVVAWQIFLGSLPMAVGSAFVDYSNTSFPSISAIICLLYNAFIAAAFCFWAYMEVVRIYPVGIATIGVMLTPIVGILSGAVVLNEPLGITEYSSVFLVSLAIGLPVFANPKSWIKSNKR